ncbi:FtsX-like permease family protein [Balneolaceae bacterium ANBcel3]|nr:FtsX-like permease family protein [Balneolaceae bacterium ANBcel3]
MMLFIKLAWRNIWRNKRRTLITAASVMFAVIFAIFPQSMNRGSHDQMIDNMARFHTGFIQIQDYRFKEEASLDNAMEYTSDIREVFRGDDHRIQAFTPRIEAFMLASGEEITRGALVMGIDLEKEDALNEITSRLDSGRFFEPGDGTAVLGKGLAGRLRLEIGDTLVLLGQGRFGMTAAGLFPVSGLVAHPITELNNQIVYLSLEDAQWLLSAEEHVTSLLVTPEQIRQVEAVAAGIRSRLDEGDERTVKTWPELMPELLQAIEFDNAGQYVISGILYMVIALGLFGTILTMTLERSREYGVLLSVGMQRKELAKVAFLEILMISFVGLIGGMAASFLILLYFYNNPITLTGDAAEAVLDFGFEPILPFSLAPDLFYNQLIIVFLIAMVISLYPVFKIYRMDILEAARS